MEEIDASADPDPLIRWAAQGMRAGIRAWAAGDAVAVACPALSRRSRIVVRGSVSDAAPLLRTVLAEVGPEFRPLGDEPLIAALAEVVPEIEWAGRFGWMDLARAPGTVPPGRLGWLADTDDGEVAALLDEAFPDSYARPGAPGVRRWAGLRADDATLLAVAAEAWSAPGVGFMAGVTTRADARGRGHAEAVCGYVTEELLATHGRVALFVDHWNHAAIALYRRLGYRWRAVAAARGRSGPG